MKEIDTLIIGAGQAGLAISYLLTQADHEHVILEKDRIASSWRQGRWDSFTLVTPNWQINLPGKPYQGDDPEGFLPREAVIEYLEDYAEMFGAPVRQGVEVQSIETAPVDNGFLVGTNQGEYRANQVVVAAGTFQRPNIPECSHRLSSRLNQLHSSDYRNPNQIEQGAVMVVGSGQSGCQIAEELHRAGREVYLATSKVGRLPRRYRGVDTMKWMVDLGIIDRTVEDLDSPAERFAPNPHVSGKDGGHTINLHRLSQQGVHLLGRVADGKDWTLQIAPDLKENLEFADQFAAELKTGVDNYAEKAGLDLPEPEPAETQAGYQVPIRTELDLKAAGINTIIWATGYDFDFSWVDFDIFDQYGYPIQDRGVTPEPGLYFLGLHWLHTIKSGLFLGVGEDAARVAEDIVDRSRGD